MQFSGKQGGLTVPVLYLLPSTRLQLDTNAHADSTVGPVILLQELVRDDHQQGAVENPQNRIDLCIADVTRRGHPEVVVA